MELRRIYVDRNFREKIQYKDAFFPLDIWTDDYNSFVDCTLNCHWHDAFEYGVVLSGELDYYINETHLHLHRGDAVFVNANMMHMAKQCADCRNAVMFTVVFPASLISGTLNSRIYTDYFKPIIDNALEGFQISRENNFGKNMIQALREIYALHDSDFGFELRGLALLSTLWHETLLYIRDNRIPLSKKTTNQRSEKRAKQIVSFVHEHYADDITVETIARSIGISRSECFRCFKKYTNKHPAEYINEYRLSQAARLLHESDNTITEIGTACGFSTSSYFGKRFKETYGMTPLEYRKQVWKNNDENALIH